MKITSIKLSKVRQRDLVITIVGRFVNNVNKLDEFQVRTGKDIERFGTSPNHPRPFSDEYCREIMNESARTIAACERVAANLKTGREKQAHLRRAVWWSSFRVASCSPTTIDNVIQEAKAALGREMVITNDGHVAIGYVSKEVLEEVVKKYPHRAFLHRHLSVRGLRALAVTCRNLGIPTNAIQLELDRRKEALGRELKLED